jgi:hypothetical protein
MEKFLVIISLTLNVFVILISVQNMQSAIMLADILISINTTLLIFNIIKMFKLIIEE